MKVAFFTLSLLAIAGCRSTGNDASLKDETNLPGAPAAQERKFADCARVSYWGGPVAQIRHAAQGKGATLTLEWVKGPDGDGDAKAEVTIAGTFVNADDRDPYQHEYQFGTLKGLLTLERRDDAYPLSLTGTHPDGTAIEELLDCRL